MEQSEILTRNPPWELGQTQPPLTGYVGLLVLLLGAGTTAWMASRGFQSDFVKLLVLLLVFLSMASVETFLFKSYRRNFDFSKEKTRQLNIASWMRIFSRELGLSVCLIVLWLLFFIAETWVNGFIIFFYVSVPLVLFFAPFYFILIEKHAIEPQKDDEFLILGNAVGGAFFRGGRDVGKIESGGEIGEDADVAEEVASGGELAPSETDSSVDARDHQRAHLFNALRLLAVKGFFIPLMVVSFIGFWLLWEGSSVAALKSNIFAPVGSKEFVESLGLWFKALFELSILVDVTFGVIGYVVTMRLFDTQFTSVEPSILGWLACIVCYPPIALGFGNVGFKAHELELPNELLISQPILSVTLGVVMVLFISTYCWASSVFGMRFANLANRGVICSGPYRFVRHPAYAAKLMGWWLAYVPFIIVGSPGLLRQALFLLAFNFVYVLRALTEERHLLREQHYRQYCERVRWRFIPGVW